MFQADEFLNFLPKPGTCASTPADRPSIDWVFTRDVA